VDVTPLAHALLVFAAFLAGVVDAIAGGGGLLTLPALIAAGLPPHLALGTNKGQSVFGSAAALWRFAREKRIDARLAARTFPLGLVGSLAGAGAVLLVPPAVLRPLVLVLLLAAAAVVALRRPSDTGPRSPVSWAAWGAPAAALLLGAYDGFFGPGTGTFLIVAWVTLLGRSLTDASADAKVVNVASNLAAVGIFAAHGDVAWSVALPMAAAQFAGGSLGAHLAVRGGDAVVRRVVLAVVTALVTKLSWDLYAG
jgi:uncharacterized membrane protein YfcA